MLYNSYNSLLNLANEESYETGCFPKYLKYLLIAAGALLLNSSVFVLYLTVRELPHLERIVFSYIIFNSYCSFKGFRILKGFGEVQGILLYPGAEYFSYAYGIEYLCLWNYVFMGIQFRK